MQPLLLDGANVAAVLLDRPRIRIGRVEVSDVRGGIVVVVFKCGAVALAATGAEQKVADLDVRLVSDDLGDGLYEG